MQLLEAQGHKAFAPDLPGLGHSSIPRGFAYSLATLAGFVTQVMDKAGIARSVLGLSGPGVQAERDTATAVDPGSGRRRKSVRKT